MAYLKKSAKGDHTPAISMVGAINYKEGSCKDSDCFDAVDNMICAANRGDAIANFNVGILRASGDVLPRAERMAKENLKTYIDIRRRDPTQCISSDIFGPHSTYTENIDSQISWFRMRESENSKDSCEQVRGSNKTITIYLNCLPC